MRKRIKKVEHYVLPYHTNTLIDKEVSSTLFLIKDIALKLNEIVDSVNDVSDNNLEAIQEQNNTIHKGILFIKDNLLNTLSDYVGHLEATGYVDDRVKTHTTTLVNEIRLLTSRLDNLLGRVTVGSTTMDLEIIDARTDRSGLTWNNLGLNIRTNQNNAFRSGNVQITPSNYTEYFTDLDKAPNNETYFISSNITPDMITNLPIYGQHLIVSTFNFHRTQEHGKYQLAISWDGKLFYRMEQGVGENPNFNEWKSPLLEIEKTLSKHTCDIFEKVICVGDSYTSGHIDIGNTPTTTNESLSWVKFLSKITGNTYINCGRSGANTRTIQTDERGLPKARTSGKPSAFLVGLGLNDVAQGTNRYVELGTINDVTTFADTYYGNYSKLIVELNKINESAKIFLFTIPNPNSIQRSYNQAVRDLREHYKATYPIHVLDLENYSELFNDPTIKGDLINGHYTAIGYSKFARLIEYVWSEYIDNNIKDFQNVYEIEVS